MVSSAAIASPMVMSAAETMAAGKPAEAKTPGTGETRATVTNATKGMKVYYIGRGCIGCHACLTFCPAKAIHFGDTGNEIDQNKCIHCGTCYNECPISVISETEF
jgi:ferredoxin